MVERSVVELGVAISNGNWSVGLLVTPPSLRKSPWRLEHLQLACASPGSVHSEDIMPQGSRRYHGDS
jgi:hypothetical protein